MAQGVAIFHHLTTGRWPVAVWRLCPPLDGYSWAITDSGVFDPYGKIRKGFFLYPSNEKGERVPNRFEPGIQLDDNVYVPLLANA